MASTEQLAKRRKPSQDNSVCKKNGKADPTLPTSDPDADLKKFYKAWAWKREHLPDRDRFQKPYSYPLQLPNGERRQLTIKQAKFKAAGFASTVWDSAIVVSKLLEHSPHLVRDKRCLDLSAGCGLVGIVAAQLGACSVVCTDLTDNLPLLQDNCHAHGRGVIQVMEHTWGESVTALNPPFNIVIATDVMYVHEAVPALLSTLQQACHEGGKQDDTLEPHGNCQTNVASINGQQGVPEQISSLSKTCDGHVKQSNLTSHHQTEILLAHGRNRFAEETFLAAAQAVFAVEQLQEHELHPDYHCSDVVVYRLTRLQS